MYVEYENNSNKKFVPLRNTEMNPNVAKIL